MKTHSQSFSILTVFIFVSLFFATSLFGQLPESWLGNYTGDLQITNYKGEVSSVPMQLSIEQKTDTSYIFEITYGLDTAQQVRNYELIHDKENQFVMDEKNGIYLPMMLFNDRFISVFEVQGNMLQVSYQLEKKHLIFRTTSSRESIKSGGANKIPEVQGYLPFVDQYARLKKQ